MDKISLNTLVRWIKYFCRNQRYRQKKIMAFSKALSLSFKYCLFWIKLGSERVSSAFLSTTYWGSLLKGTTIPIYRLSMVNKIQSSIHNNELLICESFQNGVYQFSLPKCDPLREIHTKFSYRLSIFSTTARLVIAFFVLRKRECPPIPRQTRTFGLRQTKYL